MMAPYGLKYSGTAFRAHLAENLIGIEFLSIEANPDVWYRPEVKPNFFEHHKYILCCVDNILPGGGINENPEHSLNRWGGRDRISVSISYSS